MVSADLNLPWYVNETRIDTGNGTNDGIGVEINRLNALFRLGLRSIVQRF
jgi:hypothetical protein